MFKAYQRGVNSPEDVYPFEPMFCDPCKATDRGAFRNLGGWWVRDRFFDHSTGSKGK